MAKGDDPAALAAPFDLVAVSLSKGLGAPGGSVLAGRRADVNELVRYRRMLGGAMRQVGTVVARAGERSLLVFAFGPRTVRAVTHLDLDRDACLRGAEILVEVVESSRP